MSKLNEKAQVFVDKLKDELGKKGEQLLNAGWNMMGELEVTITNEGMFDTYVLFEDRQGNVDFIRVFGRKL
jgi:hypothetical protein